MPRVRVLTVAVHHTRVLFRISRRPARSKPDQLEDFFIPPEDN